MSSRIRSVVLALSVLSLSGVARAETTECTEITSVPFTIVAPGSYCLKTSHDATGSSGVTINADDVTLDLNGHAITGALTFGVVSQSPRKNITVRNGTVRGGKTGVYLLGASGMLVEHMRVEDTTETGMTIQGTGSIVRNNVISGVNRTPGTGCCLYGMYVRGAFARVSDNQILETGVNWPSEADAIKAVLVSGAVFERNLIANSVKSTSIYPLAIQVSNEAGQKSIVAGNRISNMSGVWVTTPQTAVLVDNIVVNASTSYLGGIMVGATNHSF